MNVAGANRVTNLRPNVPPCKATSFRSTIGPTTRNTNLDVIGNCEKLAATNASASEQMHNTTASTAITRIAVNGFDASESSTDGGTATLSTAAANPPTTKNPPACKKSCAALRRKVCHLLSPTRCERSGMRSHWVLPKRSHSQPINTAVVNEATNRASVISGWPGNATYVDTSTTGLIAGAASRKVSAADGATPRAIKPPDTGTDAHSHPGRTTPDAHATGTASASFFGNALRQKEGGTKAVMNPDSITPSARNGSACTTIETKMVAPACTPG